MSKISQDFNNNLARRGFRNTHPVNIVTRLTNTTDSQSSTNTVYLDGIPETSSTIITSRIFKPETNCVFVNIPEVSFAKTKNPEDYSYNVVKGQDGSYTFNVNYFRPSTSMPTTDIIEFAASAKLNQAVVTKKIHGWNMDYGFLPEDGGKRKLLVSGDPGATFKLKMTSSPRIGAVGNEEVVLKEKLKIIGDNGTYVEEINFPRPSTESGNTPISGPILYPVTYNVVLTENIADTFTTALQNPTTIKIHQFPQQVTKFELIESGDTTWTMPAPYITQGYYLISADLFTSTRNFPFEFQVSHSANITATSVTGWAYRAVVTSGTGNTLDESLFPITKSKFKIVKERITVDNTTSPKTATISGYINMKHGYDGNGYTLVQLNVNNILEHA